MNNIIRGTQIVYVPSHANGDVNHQDCETGFVMAVRGDVAFCRYWSKTAPNKLRTEANSERTPIDMLLVKDTRNQVVVDFLIMCLEYGLTFETVKDVYKWQGGAW